MSFTASPGRRKKIGIEVIQQILHVYVVINEFLLSIDVRFWVNWNSVSFLSSTGLNKDLQRVISVSRAPYTNKGRLDRGLEGGGLTHFLLIYYACMEFELINSTLCARGI